jgi:hypothetical protein
MIRTGIKFMFDDNSEETQNGFFINDPWLSAEIEPILIISSELSNAAHPLNAAFARLFI